MPFTFQMTGALATAVNTVTVSLSGRPLAMSPRGAGDALNPGTWTVTIPATGAILHVVQVSAPVVPPRNAPPVTTPTQVQVTTLEDFPDYTQTLQVSAPNLLATDGTPITAPTSEAFIGLADAALTPEQQAVQRNLGSVDVANPPFSFPTGGGTLIMGPDGDYASETGLKLVKKLIVRRWTTDKNGFYHLPDYGEGLQVKGLYNDLELVKLKKRLELSAKQEPEVVDIDAALTSIPDVGLEIDSNVLTRSGPLSFTHGGGNSGA